jgi:hypothetical protein
MQRGGQRETHLGVVGELTRLPVERTATDHVPVTVRSPLGQAGGERACGCELERGAQRIPDRRADDRTDDPVAQTPGRGVRHGVVPTGRVGRS